MRFYAVAAAVLAAAAVLYVPKTIRLHTEANLKGARDLLACAPVSFPLTLAPLDPVLLELEPASATLGH